MRLRNAIPTQIDRLQSRQTGDRRLLHAGAWTNTAVLSHSLIPDFVRNHVSTKPGQAHYGNYGNRLTQRTHL